MGFSNRDIRSNVAWYLYDFLIFLPNQITFKQK